MMRLSKLTENDTVRSVAKRISELLGVKLPHCRVIYADRDRSYYDRATETIYIDKKLAGHDMAEVAHEFGHALYYELPDDVRAMWFDEINRVFGGVFLRVHDHELFAKTIEHMVMDDTSSPHYDERKRITTGIYR